ncbi:MAG: tetratricopeptide repeat protein [Treponema sp.]|jgi:tetratricopeptide (TPR) repeat protein|nr:tetratricopeptide repeat protein [Treponema sp.]
MDCIKAGMVTFLVAFLYACGPGNFSGGRARAEEVYVAATEAYSQEHYAEALEYLRESLRLDPNFYQARLLEGKVLFFQNRIPDAAKLFAKLAAKYPEYTEARLWNLRCLVMAASPSPADSGSSPGSSTGSPGSAASAEKLAAARDALDRELSFNPTDWRVLYLYVLLAGNTGDWEKRLSMGRRAEAALSDSAKVYLDMALSWYSLGLEERANLFLEKARIVSGNNTSLTRLAELTGEFLSAQPEKPGEIRKGD